MASISDSLPRCVVLPLVGKDDRSPHAGLALHFLLGWARYRNQEYAKSREAFFESVRINPHGAGAMAGLTWCGVMMQDSKEVEYWASRKAASCGGDVGKVREKALKLLEKYKKGWSMVS